MESRKVRSRHGKRNKSPEKKLRFEDEEEEYRRREKPEESEEEEEQESAVDKQLRKLNKERRMHYLK